MEVLLHARVELHHLLLHVRRIGRHPLFLSQLQAITLLRGGVLAPLRHREVGIHRRENLRPQRGAELLLKGIGHVQVGSQQHESQVRLGRNHAERQQLRVLVSPDFLHQLGEVGLCLTLNIAPQQLPGGIL